MIAIALVVGIVGGAATVVGAALSMRADRAAPEPAESGKHARSRRHDDARIDSPVLRRAIEATANLAERRGALGWVERQLRSADIPIRPAELIFGYVVATVAVPLIVLVVTATPLLVALAAAVVGGGPVLALHLTVTLRRKRFVAQLPDALTTLAGALRAGRSIGQGLEALAREMTDPMGRELRKIVAELRLGRPLPETLQDAADRVGSPDFRWAVLAIQIQAEVGGNLAELLDQVARTMREREQLRGEVKALTAEGRASAAMLVVLPPALGGVMQLVNPDYVRPMFTTTPGHVMLGLSAVMITGGYFWMKKVVTVDA